MVWSISNGPKRDISSHSGSYSTFELQFGGYHEGPVSESAELPSLGDPHQESRTCHVLVLKANVGSRLLRKGVIGSPLSFLGFRVWGGPHLRAQLVHLNYGTHTETLNPERIQGCQR